MPPSRNNTVKFSDLAPISAVGAGDLIPVVDTSIPTLLNKKINVQDFSRSLPVSRQTTQLGANSANWNSTYSTTLANSASWSTGGTYGSVYSANSAEYESTFSLVNANSANWDSTYSTVRSSSAAWVGLTTYTTVNSLSNNWNTGYNLASSAYTTLSALSAGYWVLKSGDQLTGALTTTKTITANFTLDELVTKRYVDAMAAATQISGNFVPSLYYTKTDLQTGIPLLSSQVLQTNSLAIGQAGASQTGIISFDANQYGTGVTGYTFNSTGNRSGLRVICGSYARFNVSEQGLSWVWGGPTFQQNLLNLGDSSGNSVIAVDHYGPYHAAPLTNSVVLRCSPSFNFFIRNYSNIFLDVPTISGHSFIADQYAVQNDGRIYNAFASPAGHNIQFASNNFFFTGNGVRTLSIAENIAPGNGGIWMRSDRIVGWSSSGDPGNSGDLRLKRIGASSLALDSGGTANTPSFTVFGDISASRDVFSTSLQSSSNLLLSAVGNITFSQSLPTAFAGLQANAPASTTSSHFRVVSSDGKTLFNVSSAGRVAIRGRSTAVIENDMVSPTRDLELVGFTQPILFKHYGSNTGFIVDEYGHGLNSDVAGCWLGASGTGARVQLWGGGPLNGVSIGTGTTGFLNTYSNGKIAIGRGSIYASNLTSPLCAHVSIVNDSTMNSYTTDLLLLSSGPGTGAASSQFYIRGFNTEATSTLSVRKDGFTVLGGSTGLGRVFLYEGSNLGIDADPTNPTGVLGLASYMGLGWSSTIAANGTKDTAWVRGAAGVIEQRASTTPQIYRIYNTYTDANNYERLSLSADRIAYEYAGTGISRDLTIQTTGRLVLSASSLSFNQTLPFNYASLSAQVLTVGPAGPTAPAPSYSGVLRVTDDSSGQLYPGIVASTTTGFTSFATYGNGGLSNIAHVRANGILAGRSVFSGGSNFGGVATGSGNFNETIPNMAIKVGGSIGFTVPQLDGSNFVRPISATMGYDWSSNLISLSSITNVQGFSFLGKSAQNGRCAIYSDNNDFLNLAAWSGVGKSIRFGDINTSTNLIGGIFGQVNYSGWQMINMSLTNFAGYTTTDTLVLNQITNQTGSYFKANNSSSSTIFEINSANNVMVRNLLSLGGTTASNAAIKGSGTTVVAKLGDDSDYAYLQGKLQTLNTAAAGTFTPDKYLILYDSTGTAYKVPVQAL